jgi:NACHT domain
LPGRAFTRSSVDGRGVAVVCPSAAASGRCQYCPCGRRTEIPPVPVNPFAGGSAGAAAAQVEGPWVLVGSCLRAGHSPRDGSGLHVRGWARVTRVRNRTTLVGIALTLAIAALSFIVVPAAVDLATTDSPPRWAWLVAIVSGLLATGMSVWVFLLSQPARRRRASAVAHPRNRQRAIANVRTYVSQRLDARLGNSVPLSLELRTHSGMVFPRPELYVMEQPDRDHAIDADADLGEAFEVFDNSLLLVGAPGSGKTTSLLLLAKALLDRAERDPAAPVPVFIELATWKSMPANDMPALDWLLRTVQQRYRIGAEVARGWMSERQLALLMDGLDEMPPTQRDVCVSWLNRLQTDLQMPPTVITSRIDEYRQLKERLNLAGAVGIRPLSRESVERYLAAIASPDLDSLRTALDDDPSLWELLTSPLWLNVMAIVYGGRTSADEVAHASTRVRRRSRLLATFITELLARRASIAPWPANRILQWLGLLARSVGEFGAISPRRWSTWSDIAHLLPDEERRALVTAWLPALVACYLGLGLALPVALREGMWPGIEVALFGLLAVVVIFSMCRVSEGVPADGEGYWRYLIFGAVSGIIIGAGAWYTAAAAEIWMSNLTSYSNGEVLRGVLLAWGLWIGLRVVLLAVVTVDRWARPKQWHHGDVRPADELMVELFKLTVVAAVLLWISPWLLSSDVILVPGGETLSAFTARPFLFDLTPWIFVFTLGGLLTLTVVVCVRKFATDMYASILGSAVEAASMSSILFSVVTIAVVALSASVFGDLPNGGTWKSGLALGVGVVFGRTLGEKLTDYRYLPLRPLLAVPVLIAVRVIPLRLGRLLRHAAATGLMVKEGNDYRFAHPLIAEHLTLSLDMQTRYMTKRGDMQTSALSKGNEPHRN